MDARDDEILRRLEQDELRRGLAEHQARLRRRRGMLAAVSGTAILALVGLLGWAHLDTSRSGAPVVLIGTGSGAVRVEIEGEEPVEVPPRRTVYVTPRRPGLLRFRFVDVETGTSFERVFDVPVNEPLGDLRLAVPTGEDTCFAMLDITDWYAEARGVLEIARERAEEPGGPRGPTAAVAPTLVARIRPLDRLPPGPYTRNLRMHDSIGADERARTLVDLPCSELARDDADLVARCIERR